MLVGGNARPAARRRRADITIPRSAARRGIRPLVIVGTVARSEPRAALGTAAGHG